MRYKFRRLVNLYRFMPIRRENVQFIDVSAMALPPDDLLLAIAPFKPGLKPDMLSEGERREWTSFQHERRRDEFLNSRHLLKLMAEQAGFDGLRAVISKNELGKPEGLYEKEPFFVSIAHTGSTVLCGLSRSAHLGVDLEPAGRRVSDRLRKRLLGEYERSTLAGYETVRLWTIKEAVVKLTGLGIRKSLHEIVLTPSGDFAFSAQFDGETKARIQSFKHDNFWVAVACFI